jgi:hypothetical protein
MILDYDHYKEINSIVTNFVNRNKKVELRFSSENIHQRNHPWNNPLDTALRSNPGVTHLVGYSGGALKSENDIYKTFENGYT